MAIVTPLLLLMIMGMVDFGLLLQRYVVLSNAAVEGARVASLPGYTDADVTTRVTDYALNGGVTGTVNAETIGIDLPGGASGGPWPGSQVTVTHVYTFEFVRPIVGMFSGSLASGVTITTRATMRNQVLAAAP